MTAGSRWTFSPHAIARYVERHAPDLHPDEALPRLQEAVRRAGKLRELTLNGDSQWRVDDPPMILVAKEEGGKIICLTILPHPDTPPAMNALEEELLHHAAASLPPVVPPPPPDPAIRLKKVSARLKYEKECHKRARRRLARFAEALGIALRGLQALDRFDPAADALAAIQDLDPELLPDLGLTPRLYAASHERGRPG